MIITMETPEEQEQERLFSLLEIIKLTGHDNTKAAYSMLTRYGHKPDGWRPAARAPKALWRRSVVEKVFHKHLRRMSRAQGISVDELISSD